MVHLSAPLFLVRERDDDQLFLAKQRASVLWLLSKAYMPKIPSELYDPCYVDHEGNERLKPQIVHALANAELYCLALANIYADPNYHNLNHHGILQVLMRKGIEIIEPSDTTLTETVMVQTAPIRMSAHMIVIEGIMALFVKEVLIPEKVMEVVSRYAMINPESELPYDSEEAALLWVNKSCVKLRHRIEDQLMNFHSSEGPNSSPTRKLRPPMIAPAQDLGDLSDGCCLAALLSLYCPKYFHWQDIRLNDPLSLADSVHNLQLVQKFCHEHLPQDVFCLTLEDMVYLHPSILPNVLTLIADLMYIFEIRPPKHICRPGYEEENRISEEFTYLNVNGQSPVPNCNRQSTQRASSPVHEPESMESNEDTGSMSPQTSNGTWQRLQKSSSRKMLVSEGRVQDSKRPYDSGCEIQPSHQNYPAEEDDELAGYFSPQHHSPSQSLLDQDDNRRTKQSHSTEDGTQQTHYRVFHATNPLRTDFNSSNDRTRKGGTKESREVETKSTLKKSPSSYEIHQLSPSKQSMGKQLQGYSRQRSQSELDIPQERKQISSGNRISYSEIEESTLPNKMPHKASTETRRNRNSFHEMPRYNTMKENEKHGKFSMPRRNNSDFFLHERQDIETRQANRLSGSQTWRKPKDLFARTEFLEEVGDPESENRNKNQDCDQENVMSFANLSKHRNDSGSSINITYTHQDRDQMSNTYKKATRPGYLHISPSQKSIPSTSPTSATKVNNWVTDNSRVPQEDMDNSVAAQMIDIRLQLEEKRKKIEQEKLRLEAMTKMQREKVGKAAFLQAMKNSNMYESSGRVGGRNFSVDDLTEDLDSVRRKWLEKRCEQDSEMNADDKEHESPSEDFQNSIEQLNCNLSDLQSDISRLTQQQETIQNMLRGSGKTPHQSESYFLHDGSTPQQQQPETSRWAEPMQHSNNIYQQPQQPMQPVQEVPHVGRGHWGQPVIPFSNLQPSHQMQNTSGWQQSSPMYPGRPSSVEPQMMSGQHMNMQHQMYETPQFPGGMPQRFSLHPQQQQQPNFGMHMQPPNTYPNDQMQNFYPNHYQGQYTGMYQHPNYNVMQNTYSGGVQNPPTQSQYSNAGFHLHRSPSANYITNREYAGSPNQPGRHFNPSQTEPMQIPRSMSKADISYTLQENSGSVADEFGRLPKGSVQNSPPNRPMLGKTFRVPKPKLASPLSPSQNQTSLFAQDSEQTQETVPQSPPPQPPPATAASSTEKKGFYISFDEADLPKKPKPKLKPKHLKARSQQKKMDRESEHDSTKDNHGPESTASYQMHRNQMKENDTEASELRFGNTVDATEERETRDSQDSSRTPPVSKSPGVGFVIGTETAQPDPDKELEMTRRKEMIMMMSLRRRAEQEAKRNQKQQEYMMKKEEERMKSEQMERKKEEEKLRRQLILEQYRQRKAAEDDDGPQGGRDDHRPPTKGTPVTRPKSSLEELQGYDRWIGGNALSSSSCPDGKPDVKSKCFILPSAVLLLSYGILMGTRSASVTRSKPKSGPMSSSRTHDLSSPSSLDSPVGKGSQYNLSSGYHDDVSSEHSYTPSPRRSQNYPHSSPISPSSYPSSPGPLLPGLLSSSNRSRGTPSDGLSDTSSTISSAWASEYTGPKLFVKPSTKSNRGIITNAINTVLAGAVNSETKRKVLEEIDRSDGKHFLILFRDAGCQFRALYSYNPETEEVIKMYGIGPRVVTNKMMDRFYKYNSGGKSFTQIHTKHLTATIDAFTIQNSLWQSKKGVPLKRDYL